MTLSTWFGFNVMQRLRALLSFPACCHHCRMSRRRWGTRGRRPREGGGFRWATSSEGGGGTRGTVRGRRGEAVRLQRGAEGPPGRGGGGLALTGASRQRSRENSSQCCVWTVATSSITFSMAPERPNGPEACENTCRGVARGGGGGEGEGGRGVERIPRCPCCR